MHEVQMLTIIGIISDKLIGLVLLHLNLPRKFLFFIINHNVY